MKKWLLLSLFVIAGLIAGCGLSIPFGQGQYYRVEFTPAEFGFEVSQSGTIVVVGNKAQVLSAPGAPAGVLQSVEIVYLKGDGTQVFANEPPTTFTLHQSIPEGIVCAEGADSCTKASENWTYGWAKSDAFELSMEGKVAREYLDEMQNNEVMGWHAHIVFHAVTTAGKAVSWEQDVKIVFPLKAG